MKKILIFSSLFFLLLGIIYQKVKITILAYQVCEKKGFLDKLVEEKEFLVYNFYQSANLLNLAERLSQEEITLNSARRYVKLTPSKSEEKISPGGESLFAKVLSFGSKVEAQP
ncbi:MAG: hypothetical protein J7K37_00950 [Candidatus Omnitrophica bacterium]|nr:hypothetical protein [Candidatus Omnitrophota bacterium]